jgi:hypothetical protein
MLCRSAASGTEPRTSKKEDSSSQWEGSHAPVCKRANLFVRPFDLFSGQDIF